MIAKKECRLTEAKCVRILWVLVLTSSSALGTTSLTPFYMFEIPRSDVRSLEQAACRPLKRRMQTSTGHDSDEDRSRYSAHVQCTSHRSIDGQPVVYDRSCTRKDGWNCEFAKEAVIATFADRQVQVTTGDGDLETAYAVVKHFVEQKLIEPRPEDSSVTDRPALPRDECELRLALQNSYDGGLDIHSGSQYQLKCDAGYRQVLRFRTREGVRYRQIPMPGCAAPENPECLAEKE